MKNSTNDDTDHYQRAEELTDRLSSLAAEVSGADPALRARLEAALNVLRSGIPGERNTALTSNPADVRALVRDLLAEELARFGERRFGRSS